SVEGDDVEVAVGVAGAKGLLVELADAGLGDLVDEGPALGQLPLGELACEEVAEFGGGGGGAVGQDDGAQGALVPLLVGDADDGGLGDGGVAHDGVLQVDRGDPLAAGLDDVLGAVNQGQVAVGGDLADVAGAQPPVVELVGVHLGAIGGVV